MSDHYLGYADQPEVKVLGNVIRIEFLYGIDEDDYYQIYYRDDDPVFDPDENSLRDVYELDFDKNEIRLWLENYQDRLEGKPIIVSADGSTPFKFFNGATDADLWATRDATEHLEKWFSETISEVGCPGDWYIEDFGFKDGHLEVQLVIKDKIHVYRHGMTETFEEFLSRNLNEED
ncbi:MAG: hypothetical protein D6698_15440 [Gammaproteobacteria bacterium]|nr:MAG: hypothetical protein D6698_15440 [Gammaproteobacteria bacterium]